MTYRKSFRLSGFLILFIFVLLTASAYAAGPVPDTGLTTSYTDTFGEDSDYLINPPSYTKLGQDGVELADEATVEDGWIMTRDNVTGLIWEVKTDDDSVHDRDNIYTWCDTDSATNGGDSGTCGEGTDTEDFIAALNTVNFGGFSDWRLPTRKELRTIVDYSADNPAISEDFFPYTRSSDYWSSTTFANHSSYAWGMGFSDGRDYLYYKSGSDYVRAVRGGQSGSVDHLVINGDGTVTDTDTGLMWQQQDDDVGRTWENALVYCEDATLADYDDWRLPTIKELDSIVDLTRHNPSIDPVFSGTNSSYYWSSTTFAAYTDYARCVDFYAGNDYGIYKSEVYYVRAVRGGQIRTFGNLVILAPKPGDAWNQGETKTILWETKSISGDVSITLSRDGGKTFDEVISAATPNDGSYEWMVSGKGSYNCMLKIIPLSDTLKYTTQGLFTIDTPKAMPHIPLLLLDD